MSKVNAGQVNLDSITSAQVERMSGEDLKKLFSGMTADQKTQFMERFASQLTGNLDAAQPKSCYVQWDPSMT